MAASHTSGSGPHGGLTDIREMSPEALSLLKNISDGVQVISSLKKKEEKERPMLSLMYNVACVFRKFPHISNDNLYEILPNRAFHQYFDEYIASVINGFWALRHLYLDKGKHELSQYSIDVVSDGSCFYQSLYFALLWMLPLEDLKKVDGVKKMKQHVFNLIYEKQGSGTYKCLKRQEMRELTDAYGQVLDMNDISPSGLMKLMGLDQSNDNLGRRKWGGEIVAEIFSLALNVQIIIYAWCDGDQNFRENEQNFHLMQFRQAQQTQEGKNLKLARLSATTRGSIESHFHIEYASFSGKPVILLLLNEIGNHYNVLSTFPALDGMRRDGTGIAGQPIPQFLMYQEFTHNGTFRMPVLDRCFHCNLRIANE